MTSSLVSRRATTRRRPRVIRITVSSRLTLHATGRASGLQLDERVALRFHWDDRRLARMRYMDRDEAERIVKPPPARASRSD